MLDIERSRIAAPSLSEQGGVRKDGKLPVTLAEAKAGVQDFYVIANSLPAQFQQKFVNSHDLLRGFIGLTPEVGIFHTPTTPHDLYPQVVIQTSREVTDNILFVPHYFSDGSYRKTSLINRQAVKTVMNNYPQFFEGRAIEDVDTWIAEHAYQWLGDTVESDEVGHICCVRHGVLSGFPVDSVLQFKPYADAGGKLDVRLLTPEEEKYFYDFRFGRILRNTENATALRQLLERMSPKRPLSEDEIQILTKSRIMPSFALGGFIGFDYENDKKYINRAEDIYIRSGAI